ncbi:hypothetical protein MLD38_011705 [Melastoma candidum]|uniref:Uncharacterized protein n=1 Tax=Melastoma candidum TaxID=119954 RepID=A0ACB9R4H1_9MYRT|nr:hypothetical protein MLD38_011705 [Melastoma candidum]
MMLIAVFLWSLKMLCPCNSSWHPSTVAGQALDGVLMGGRGFGVAMDALINYLGSEYGSTFALARVFAFLSGPPDYGTGQLDARRHDLASLKFLRIESGSSLLSYSHTDDSTLPQDLHTAEPPVLQIAFQYSIVVPPEAPSDPDKVTSNRFKYSLQRRLRIRTVQYNTARNMNELYDSMDPEVVLSLLVHKVILASLEQGVREGRMLLHDWLVDVSFSQCPQLQHLSRLVFALLRNPLLLFHEEGVHPDYRIFLQCLFSALEPSSLHYAVYPTHPYLFRPLMTIKPLLYFDFCVSDQRQSLSSSVTTSTVISPRLIADDNQQTEARQECHPEAPVHQRRPGRCLGLRELPHRVLDGSGLSSVMGLVSFLEEITQSVLEYIKWVTSCGDEESLKSCVEEVERVKESGVGQLGKKGRVGSEWGSRPSDERGSTPVDGQYRRPYLCNTPGWMEVSVTAAEFQCYHEILLAPSNRKGSPSSHRAPPPRSSLVRSALFRAMATRIAARYACRRLSSSGKILSEEEKAAENVYIKKMEKEKLEKLARKGPNEAATPTPGTGPVTGTTSPEKASTDKYRNYAVVAGTITALAAIGWYVKGTAKKPEVQD